MQTVITNTRPYVPLVDTVQSANFDDNMPKYKVLCWHVKNWGYFVGAYDMMMVVLAVMWGFYLTFGVFYGVDTPGTGKISYIYICSVCSTRLS